MSWRNHLLVVPIFLILSGCASLPVKSPTGEDVAPKRKERQHQVINDFASRRDKAQLKAALARWNEGDEEGCKASLKQLLVRNPQNKEAGLAIADLFIHQNYLVAAEQQLRIMATSLDDAQVHHSLGLILETTGRRNEAVARFQRAFALNPENELFALSLEAAIQPTAAEIAEKSKHPMPLGPSRLARITDQE